MKYSFIVVVLAASCFTLSCKKDNNTPPSPPPTPVSFSGVYIAGLERAVSVIPQTGHTVAKYWKDGVPVILSDSTRDAGIYDIVVTDNAVYCCGFEQDKNFVTRAKYWVNGKGIELPDGTLARAIDVTNGLMSIVGENSSDVNAPVRIWINGAPSMHIVYSQARSFSDVCNKGTIPYVCGIEYTGTVPSGGAALWVNHVQQNFIGASIERSPMKIKVVGNDVYMCNAARYILSPDSSRVELWKNGIVTTISDVNTANSPSDLAVDLNDVYISGTSSKKITNPGGPFTYEIRPTYWKNGLAVPLSIPTNISNAYGYATGIGLQGKDVIVCGYTGGNTNINTAVIWKNGVRSNLTDGKQDAFAYSMFIK